MTESLARKPLARNFLSLRDIGVAVAIFCASLAFTIDYSPRPINPMDTPNLSFAGSAAFMAAAYLAFRTILNAGLAGMTIFALYGTTVIVTCLSHIVLTSGDINYLPTLEPSSWIGFPMVGLLMVLFGVDHPPDVHEIVIFVSYVLIQCFCAVAWGGVGYLIAMRRSKPKLSAVRH